MKSTFWVAGALAGAGIASAASAQDVEDQFGLLLPQPGTAGIDYKIGIEGRLEEDTGLGQADVFVPFSTSDSSAFFLNGGGRYRFDVDDEDEDDVPEVDGFDFEFDDNEAWSAFLGAGYRTYIGDASIIGLNAYLEGGEVNAIGAGDKDMFWMGTLGAEYQRVLNFESATTVTLGVNGYIPFEDYTDPGELSETESFVLSGAAPRLGADIYATVGHNFTGADVRLEGTVGGFYYEGQNDASDDDFDEVFDFEEGNDLPGAIGELGLTYYGFDGFNIKGMGGVRYADYSAGDQNDLEWYGGLRGEITFGGDTEVERTVTREVTVPGNPIVPERDCAVVRQPDGTSTYDCSQRVVTDPGMMRDSKGGKGVVYDAQPLPPAPPTTRTETETVVDVVPGLPVPNPRRHIAFGDPLVPLNFDVDAIEDPIIVVPLAE